MKLASDLVSIKYLNFHDVSSDDVQNDHPLLGGHFNAFVPTSVAALWL